MKNVWFSAFLTSAFLTGVVITSNNSVALGATVVDAQTLEYQDQKWVPVDDDGVFYYLAGQSSDTPMPVADVNLKERYPTGNAPSPVRLKLVDYIDCTKKDHGFNETPATPDHHHNSPSRVLNIDGTDYRVTGQPQGGFDLFWYSYRIKVNPPAGQPYLLVAQMPNDVERYTSISMRMPDDAIWMEPYTGAEKKRPDCQSGDCDHPGVGLTVYTGREFPTDDKSYLTSYIFYPRSEETILHIASSGWYRDKPVQAGAAVSKIWIFKIADSLQKHAARISKPDKGPERNIGIYMTHPWYLVGHYGIPAHKEEDRKRALTLMADQMNLSGLNWIEFNAVNGSDRTGATWYPSDYFHQLCADLLKELPPIAEERGIQLIPVITSLIVPGHQGELPNDGSPNKEGFSKDSFLYLSNGRDYATAFGSRNANPLRPEVQAYLINIFKEIAEQSKDKPAVKGLGFRVNGKIGLCFTSHEPEAIGAKQVGYGPWTLSEFKNDTGIAVPMEPGQAYDWLRARPDNWEKWIDWRCQRTHDFWLRIRDVIREYRPDWNLYVKTVLPSELPGTNIEWVEEQIPAVDLLRQHGYDPALYVHDKGIVIEQTMMIDQDRYYTRERWGPPHGQNSDAYKNFYYQPGLMDLYKTAEGEAVEFYHSYIELAFHPDVEFGWGPGGFRTDTGAAKGRYYLEAVTHAIRNGNPLTLTEMGWENPVLGQEARLRPFAQAWRALPYTDPAPVAASVTPNREEVWVRGFGDRIAVLNDQVTPEDIAVKLYLPVPEGKQLVDVVNGEVFIRADSIDRQHFTIKMREFELRTLEVK